MVSGDGELQRQVDDGGGVRMLVGDGRLYADDGGFFGGGGLRLYADDGGEFRLFAVGAEGLILCVDDGGSCGGGGRLFVHGGGLRLYIDDGGGLRVDVVVFNDYNVWLCYCFSGFGMIGFLFAMSYGEMFGELFRWEFHKTDVTGRFLVG